MLQIFVKSVTGKTIALDVDSSDIVEIVKMKIEDREDIPVRLQILYFSGKVLDSICPLAHYGIQRECTLHLSLRTSNTSSVIWGEELETRLLGNDPHVTQLDLSNTQIQKISSISRIVEASSVLSTLNLGACEIDDTSAIVLARSLRVNSTLTTLHLGTNNIGDIGARALAQALHFNKALIRLHVNRNSIGDQGAADLADALLVNSVLQTLILHDNRVGDSGAKRLASTLRKNRVLTTLNLGENRIGKEGAFALGASVGGLPRDRLFNLGGICLSEAARDLGLLSRAKAWSNEKIVQHLQDAQSGPVVRRRAKLMVVGRGLAGKSTLLHRLRTGTYVGDLEFTDGMTMGRIEAAGGTGRQDAVELVTLDFGGQSMYMTTNPLFFSPRGIYMLVWNPRAEQSLLDALHDYVAAVRSRAPSAADAPVVLVSTRADEYPEPVGVDAALRKLGEGGARHFHVSSKDGRGIDALRAHLAALARSLLGGGRAVPRCFLDFEQALQAEPDAPCGAMPLERAMALGGRWGMSAEDVRWALAALSDWGSVTQLDGGCEAMRRLVFVDLAGLAQLVATLVTVREDKRHLLPSGVLRHADVAQLWAAHPPTLHPALLALMHLCEAAYPLPGGEASLVPAMLPEDEPPDALTWLAGAGGALTSAVRLRLGRLPHDLLPRLLVRTARFAAQERSWRGGALLERGRDRAVLRQAGGEGRGELLIRCQGAWPIGLRGLLFQTAERLCVDLRAGPPVVQASCPECGQWACSPDKLARKLRERKQTLECGECDAQVAITDLVSGVSALSEAELALQVDLDRCPRTTARPEQLELLRRDTMRVLHIRLGRPPDAPGLWVPIGRAKGGGWRVAALCEDPGCWHRVSGMEGRVASVASDYFVLIAPAVAALAEGVAFDAEALQEAQSAPQRGPMQGEQLVSLLRSMMPAVASAGASPGAAQLLQPVCVPEGPPLWLCGEHAVLHSRSGADLLVEGAVRGYVQWMFLDDCGQFRAMDASTGDVIESAHVARRNEVCVKCGCWDYQIVFKLPQPAPASAQKSASSAATDSQGAVKKRGPGQQQSNAAAVRNGSGEDAAAFQVNVETKRRRDLLRRVFFPILPRLPDGGKLPQDAPEFSPVTPGSALWTRIQNRVTASLPHHMLVSLDRIANKFLWERYCTGSWEIARKNGGNAGERELFHFSNDMERLINGTSGGGFDPRMKQPSGVEYGRGIYFAEHAAYSVAYGQGWLRSGEPPADEDVTILLALVALGDCKDFGPLCTSHRGNAIAAEMGVAPGLRDFWGEGEHRNRPPRKNPADPDSPLFDSVSGSEADLAWSSVRLLRRDGERLGRQCVVFDSRQAYPYLRLTLRLRQGRPASKKARPC